jgi:acyl-CoA thioester hydrolase
MNSNEPRPLEVVLHFPVRTYDIDFAGVVSNIVYIRWLEDLRLTILERHYPLERFLEAGVAPTLIETHIRYIRPVTIHDRPVGRMWMSMMRKLKFGFHGEISVNGEIAVTADQVGCLLDMSDQKPVVMPDELVNQYRDHVKNF